MSPEDVEKYKPFTSQLLASAEIRQVVFDQWGDDAEALWSAFQRGERLQELYEEIGRAATWPDHKSVSHLMGAVTGSHEFAIEILRVGPVFFHIAEEHPLQGPFESQAEAERDARCGFADWIQAYEDGLADGSIEPY